MHWSFFSRKVVLLLFFLACVQCHGEEEKNPYLIDFPIKQELSREDYMEVQARLRKVDMDPILKEQYVADGNYTTFEDLKSRACRGLNQVLIDPENKEFPVRHLEKIGSGGDCCFISCVPITPKYVAMIKSIPEALREVGFNGHFLYQIGGYPNPTGKEIRYAGVPYAFKIFMMLEAKKIGFNKVIWIDSSVLPLKDPSPLFAKLDEEGSLIAEFQGTGYADRCIFPKTKELLHKLTGTDVVNRWHPITSVFGLKMDAPKVEKFVSSYYEMVEKGTPFISCFPEEFVFSAIMGQSPGEWPGVSIYALQRYQSTTDPKELADLKAEQNAFFYLRFH